MAASIFLPSEMQLLLVSKASGNGVSISKSPGHSNAACICDSSVIGLLLQYIFQLCNNCPIMDCCSYLSSMYPVGDTVSSLISAAALPEDSKVFFYTINPTVKNGTESLPAGSQVTVPCFRITEFYRLAAVNATAPSASNTAATGK